MNPRPCSGTGEAIEVGKRETEHMNQTSGKLRLLWTGKRRSSWLPHDKQ